MSILLKKFTLFGEAAAGGSVLLDVAWHLNSFDSGALSSCGITFETDGSLTANFNDTSDEPAADNWWTDNPDVGIGSSYDVRYTAITGSWTSSAAAINTWVQISVARTWTVRVLGKNSPDTKAANAVTFEIRATGSGSAIDSIAGCSHSASN